MPRKRLAGTIKSLSGDKTVRIEVVRTFHHPLYRKRMKVAKSYLAHFEGDVNLGQEVVIEETRPISKRKKWRVVEVDGKPIGKPKQDSVEAKAQETTKSSTRKTTGKVARKAGSRRAKK